MNTAGLRAFDVPTQMFLEKIGRNPTDIFGDPVVVRKTADQSEVLRVLRRRPMRVVQIGFLIGVRRDAAEAVCLQLVSNGSLTVDDEGFFSLAGVDA